MAEKKRYTDEVLAALASQQPPPKPPAPDGHLTYAVQVGASISTGTGTAETVACLLRALADSVSPPNPTKRST